MENLKDGSVNSNAMFLVEEEVDETSAYETQYDRINTSLQAIIGKTRLFSVPLDMNTSVPIIKTWHPLDPHSVNWIASIERATLKFHPSEHDTPLSAVDNLSKEVSEHLVSMFRSIFHPPALHVEQYLVELEVTRISIERKFNTLKEMISRLDEENKTLNEALKLRKSPPDFDAINDVYDHLEEDD